MKITMPLYLGRAIDEDTGYYFLGYKNGLVRFIKYNHIRDVVFWCDSTSLPDFLDSGEVPEYVLNKVINFVGEPIEVTTLVTSGKRKKRGSAFIPNQQEVIGESNVQSDIPRRKPTQQSEGKTSSEDSSLCSGSQSEKSRVPGQEATGSENCTTESKKGRRSKGKERAGSGLETKTSDGSANLRGISSIGGGGSGSLPTTNEPDARRDSGRGVLDSSRDAKPGILESSSDGVSSGSGRNGSDGVAGLKQKRKRRTKAEMEEARRLAALEGKKI